MNLDRDEATAGSESLVVVSPHLDDGVFGCGELIASRPGAVVVTVFAGLPEADWSLPDWDALCGFASGRQAVAARRREDREALEILQASACWLNFLDSQYRRTPTLAEVTNKLARALRRRRPGTVAMPLGLFHDDHRLAHEASLSVLTTRGGSWLAYAEPNYRVIPGLLEERLAELESKRIRAVPARPTLDRVAADFKRRAVHCYASQLRGLEARVRGGYADVFAPERYWTLTFMQETKLERQELAHHPHA
jgi:LmbE family N-acetylglucosaminyl deacetylase